MVGQDEAVTAVANAIRRFALLAVRSKQTIWQLLFWPYGLGKTNCAKLCRLFVDSEEPNPHRMPEYMEKHSVSRLNWCTPGYVAMKKVLFDEQVRRNLTAWCCWMKWKKPIPMCYFC